MNALSSHLGETTDKHIETIKPFSTRSKDMKKRDQFDAYFDKLTAKRRNLADTLKGNREFSSIWDMLIGMYSDSAHFIYELLQNADDAGATRVQFELKIDCLIFTHNGTKRFTVSDPDSLYEDQKTGNYGDINAITAVGSSTKKEESNKVGKFGIGFKSVFQYTNTPHIYDSNIWFKIEDYIIPIRLDKDYDGRKETETVFVFPFDNLGIELDNPEIKPSRAYTEILEKLENLENPVLFLSNLREVHWKDSTTKKEGLYALEIFDSKTFEMDTPKETIAEHIHVHYDETDDCDTIWLFSRITESNLKYSVGFWMDPDDHFIPWDQDRAYCYFTTSEVTHLNFIIHAPFLLTHNRANVKAKEPHNQEMIQRLAELASDALVYFRDMSTDEHTYITDKIFDLIPIDESVFGDINNSSWISFKPFYTEIKKKFETERLIPGIGHCVSSKHAYWAWANVPKLVEMFPNNKLQMLTGDNDAEWILPNTPGRESLRQSLKKYIDSLYYDCFEDVPSQRSILIRLTPGFIEQQSLDWLIKLYEWCSETEKRLTYAKECPIFLNQDHKAVKMAGIYLPVDNMDEMTFLHPSLIEDGQCKKLLVEKYGFREPSKLDYIKDKIVPYYQNIDNTLHQRDYEADFNFLYNYYLNKCTQSTKSDFLGLIKNLPILRNDDNYIKPNNLYFPKANLSDYLEISGINNIVDLDYYLKITHTLYDNQDSKNQMESFFSELGVQQKIQVDERIYEYRRYRYNYFDDRDKFKQQYPEEISIPIYGNYNDHRWECYYLPGLRTAIMNACKSLDNSSKLWRFLCDGISDLNTSKKACTYYCKPLRNKYYSKCEYFYSPDYFHLKLMPWLVDKRDTFIPASKLTNDSITNPHFTSMIDKSMLSDRYDLSLPGAKELCEYLEIQDTPPVLLSSSNDKDTDNVNDEMSDKNRIEQLERENDKLLKKNAQLEKENAEKDEKLKKYEIQEKKREERRQRKAKLTQKGENPYVSQKDNEEESEDFDDYDNSDCSPESSRIQVNIDKYLHIERQRMQSHSFDESYDVIVAENYGSQNSDDGIQIEIDNDEIDFYDSDTYLPVPVNYNNRIKRSEQQHARKICELERADKLQDRTLSSVKYSFGWFKALIELEACQVEDDNKSSRKISISFCKVEREANTDRTLILRHPNKPIPAVMEELADISMTMSDKDRQYSVVIEVASIKSFTLRVKVRSMKPIEGVDLDQINEIHIEAKSPAFLWTELLNGFRTLQLSDEDNMQQNLPRNIEFIFGPPGTGKTTHLADKVIIPKMQEHIQTRILVLTPTNKAADVLVRRIMESKAGNCDYKNWLIRFGVTADDNIEKCGLLHDSAYDIGGLSRCVVITTIARFPYDYYITKGNRIHLSEIDWTFIVLDEASMIPLANIIYPLFKLHPEKFYIAGDPFQIEPITSIDLWKDENIYTMTQLKSFSNPHTIPYEYPVTLLKKQYRSIPSIGEVFSRFKYDAILEHHRTCDSQKPLNIGMELDALNLIKFPVKRYESIYRCKRLNTSNYQIYSALFTYEFVSFFARKIANNNTNSSNSFKLGIISPYRVQADLISKLIERENLPEMIEITAGTIHSFQGDECDVMFAVFNTPESITDNSFVNRDSILNVAISRARDYLFVIMPDEKTNGIENLVKVNSIEKIMRDCSSNLKCYYSNDLEKIMFGSDSYLEDNAFTTSHQSVNVYSLPEKTYEIRSEATAIDIQISQSHNKSIVPHS